MRAITLATASSLITTVALDRSLCLDEVVGKVMAQASDDDKVRWASNHVREQARSVRRELHRGVEAAVSACERADGCLTEEAREQATRLASEESRTMAEYRRSRREERDRRGFASTKDMDRADRAAAAARAEQFLRFTVNAVAAVAELLNTEFAVDRTGRRVTWGEASINDHTVRAEMMAHNARLANSDARLHCIAVRILVETRQPSLNQVREQQPEALALLSERAG